MNEYTFGPISGTYTFSTDDNSAFQQFETGIVGDDPTANVDKGDEVEWLTKLFNKTK